MKSEIKFWESVILSNKDIEPRTREQMAAFDIAEYMLKRELNKVAA